ncbi:HAMP domain-containing histidine kinase [Sphingomonas sp. MG17]|uniref:histidine kinase n=1 Tax=Sphingomonas tagetis TaxID=2949092 RepID=A0A9X2KLR1_9SPHN|nr:HAMP domain-containing histidine kinase [Sphingomonas tagetis]
MRFDDTLETVLAADVSTPFGKASAWRQLVDLIGRRRVPADPRALKLLNAIRGEVPAAVRAASARALELAQPPYALVTLCATDDIAAAAPVLRGAQLNSGEWIELLPRLSAAGRAVVRARRDLPPGVERALATFTADFAIETAAVAATPAGTIAELLGRIRERPHADTAEGTGQDEAAVPQMPATSFVSIGAAAKSIPVVAAALQQAADGETTSPQSETSDEPSAAATLAPESGDAHDSTMAAEDMILADPTDTAMDRAARREPVDAPAVDGPFEIADVVARIDAFYTRQIGRPAAPVKPPRADGFRFETDEQGFIRWVDGVARAPLIGLSLDVTATGREAGVDGVVAGAFRRRAAFSDARLVVAGESDAAGDWRISATAAFDPATGRFAGYRGTARRPRAEEDAAPAPQQGAAADSLRQLMHELRTPTNAIAGFAEMIERQMLGEAPDVYRERAAAIRDHARALLAAIDDLDIAARIEASALRLQPGEVALRPLLVRIADDLGPLTEMRHASIVLPAGNAVVAGDPRAVERLLSRMLATLMSAAGEGEAITVRLAEGDNHVALGFTRPRAMAAYPDEALFGIDDEREDAALLGTGFALRLVRNLARELSGSLVIAADSLTIRLPAAVTKSLEVVR